MNAKRKVGKSWLAIMGAVIIGATFLNGSISQAQTFNSGSTGADGAFAPSTNITLAVPANGIFNFTTVTIPTGVTVTFTPNASNTPVTMLATSDVSISGTLKLSGDPGQSGGSGGFGGAGGPGGFRGGNGHNIQNIPGGTGIGPGGGVGNVSFGGPGGYATAGTGTGSPSPIYGAPELLPLIGGSGGGGCGGGTPTASFAGGGGGGGGGAILIASPTAITIQTGGLITATGGQGGSSAGGGSGGAIRLVAGLVKVASISGTALNAKGGPGGIAAGGDGRIRLEGYAITLSGSQILPTATTGLPTVVSLANAPTLSIVSVGGIQAPSNPTGAGGGLDMTLPNQTGPTTIELAASGIPLGTTIDVSIKPAKGSPVSATSAALTGTVSSSTATATATLPSGSSIIAASVTLSAGGSASLESPFMFGGEPVEKIQVAARYGGGSSVTYITKSGLEHTIIR